MKWFKHDSDASMDTKLIKLRIKHGMEGYGLYWYCLEQIARNIERHNLTFELEHDSEVIAHDTGIHYERVQEMMQDMIKLGLFESDAGIITCLKMAIRLDDTTSRHPEIKALQDRIRKASEDSPKQLRSVSEDSPETLRTDQNRTEQNRTEENISSPSGEVAGGKPPPCPHQEIIDLYHQTLPELRQVRIWNEARKKLLAKRWRESPERQNLAWWQDFFGYVRKSAFLMGDKTDFDADLEWLIRPTNFAKVIEGKYEDAA